MATNDFSIQTMERVVELIDELNAWKKVLARHKAQQKRQMHPTKWVGRYDKDTKKVKWTQNP